MNSRRARRRIGGHVTTGRAGQRGVPYVVSERVALREVEGHQLPGGPLVIRVEALVVGKENAATLGYQGADLSADVRVLAALERDEPLDPLGQRVGEHDEGGLVVCEDDPAGGVNDDPVAVLAGREGRRQTSP